MPGAWSELVAADPAAGPAHRPELWAALAGEGATLRFLAVEEQGALVGGAAVVARRRGGLVWLDALPFMLSGAPLARPGARPAVDRAVGLALARLQRGPGVVGGTWTFYRPDGDEADPAVVEAPAGETRLLETTLIDVTGGLGRALERAPRSARFDVRRARALGLEAAEEPQALEAVYALHRLQARAWPGHRPVPLELSRALLRAGAAAPVARVFTVRERGRLLCGTLFLDHPRELLAWWSGARPEARPADAAPLLYAFAIEWAHRAGRQRLNLGGSPRLAGAAAFKRGLGGRPRRFPVRWLAPGPSPAARLVAALQARARAGRFRGDPS